MKPINKFVLLLFLFLKQFQPLNIVDSDFVQIGGFDLSDTQLTTQVNFANSFTAIPKIIISQMVFDTKLQMVELDYVVSISNINQQGFTATLNFSPNSKVFEIALNYTATVEQNINSFSTSLKVSNMQQSSDSNYNIYTTKIPFSQKNLIDTPGVNVKVVGYITGYYQKSLPSNSNLMIICTFFEIKQAINDKYNIVVSVKELNSVKGQLQEIRFNYFEYYYYENTSRMVDVYEERSFEIINSVSNCLFNDLTSYDYTNLLDPVCKTGLNYEDLNVKYSRIQVIPNPIVVKHLNKQDFMLGFSITGYDFYKENGRSIIRNYEINQDSSTLNNDLIITYFTWQGARIIAIGTTIVEYYNLACPDNTYFYSFSSKTCVQNCESHTYKEKNTLNKNLLPTCQACHQSCLECSGPLSTNCLNCSNTSIYFNNKTNECLISPPATGFICKRDQSSSNPTYQWVCSPCADSACDQCSDTISNSCTKCQNGAYLYKNTCSFTKPPAAYCDINRICQDCTVQFCLNCNSPTTCDNCPPSFYLDVNSFQCKCPYGTFLDSLNSQCSPCTKNCANCTNAISCAECAFNSSPDPINPGKCIKNCNPGTYYDRQTGKCQQCDINCSACSVSSLNCTLCKSGATLVYNTSSQMNECLCSDPKDVYNDINGTCQHCTDIKCIQCNPNDRNQCLQCIESAYLIQGNSQCACIPSTFYSQSNNKCIPCSQSNCSECSVDGTQCTKCNSGFYFNNKSNDCTYCTGGKYADSSNQCLLDCPNQCNLCSSANKCEKYIENAVFTGDQCFYACSKCSGSNYNQCIECNSPTRTLDINKKTCLCKSSYREIDTKDCEYNPDSSFIFQVASISSTAQYFAYLPIVFITFHPFSDYFMINSQLIGNHYYSKNSNFIGIFVSHFAKFNYFNLFDKQVSVVRSSIPQRENSSELYNSIPFFAYAFLCYICIIIAYIIRIIQFKKVVVIQKQSTFDSRDFKLENENTQKEEEIKIDRKEKLKNYFNWNLFIKVNRISSNLIMMYTINKYEEIFKSINIYSVSIVIYACFYLTFIILMAYTIKALPVSQSLKYLTDNLHNRSTLTIYLWLLTEIKKIAFCFFFLLQSNSFLWAQFSLCAVILLYLIASKPCQEKRRDCLYLILSEFILILILINLLIMKENQSVYTTLQETVENQFELINIIQLLQIIFSTLHTLVVIEYAYRLFLEEQTKYLNHQQQEKQKINNNNNCNMIEQKIQQQGLTIDKIQNILNQRSFSIQLHNKKSFQKTLL